MVPVGGIGVMLVLIAAAALVSLLFGLLLRRAGAGRSLAVTIGLLVWTLATVAVVTLTPVSDPGIVPAEGRLASCSWDIGGPAPDGFWIFSGTQRLLNVALFVPSGTLMTYACAHARGWAWVMVPWGLVALGCFSAGLELTQLGLARLDRACDVTDIIDNVTGAALGVLLGVVAAVVLRPWRSRRRRALDSAA